MNTTGYCSRDDSLSQIYVPSCPLEFSPKSPRPNLDSRDTGSPQNILYNSTATLKIPSIEKINFYYYHIVLFLSSMLSELCSWLLMLIKKSALLTKRVVRFWDAKKKRLLAKTRCFISITLINSSGLVLTDFGPHSRMFGFR